MVTLSAARQDILARRFSGQHARLSRRLAAQLRAFFRAQGRRVVVRYLAQYGIKAQGDIPATLSEIDLLPVTREQDEEADLNRALEVFLLAMLLTSSALAATTIDGTILTASDVPVRAILAESINQTRGITETTRQAIRAHIAEGARRSYTVQQVADGVLDDAYPSLASVVESSYARRVEVIASTEMARAQSLGIAETYRMNGVERVLIRDGTACGWDGHDSPDKANGSIRTVAEYRETPLSHPYCLIGETVVLTIDGAPLSSSSRWFEGEVVVLCAAGNELLTCTPEHPILTDRGWLAANEIQEGDHVFRSTFGDWMREAGPDNYQVPACIEDVASSFGETLGRSPVVMPPTTIDLNHDPVYRKVGVIGSDRLSEVDFDPVLLEQVRQALVKRADVSLMELLGYRLSAQFLLAAFESSHGGVSGCGSVEPAIYTYSREIQRQAVALPSDWPASNPKSLSDIPLSQTDISADGFCRFSPEIPLVDSSPSLDLLGLEGVAAPFSYGPCSPLEGQAKTLGIPADNVGDLLKRVAGFVECARIDKLVRRHFAGHVYNLETKSGWFVANGIITHNCIRLGYPIVGRQT